MTEPTEPLLITDKVAQHAASVLAQRDSALAPVIDTAGLCPIRPHANYYQELVESIVGQQLSVKAAASIRARFITLFDNTFPTPEQMLATSVEGMREIGFSRAKPCTCTT